MALTAYDLAGPDPRPMSKAEVDALKNLAHKLPDQPTIIQIGAERGCSTLAFLEARPDAFIFSIDVGERPQERENLNLALQDTRRVVRGLGHSQNIGQFWPSVWLADLVYIDGDHRYEAVAKDIDLWMPAVCSGGYLAFHDFIAPDERASHIVGRVYEAIMDAGLFETVRPCLEVERLLAFKIEWMGGFRD